MNLDPEAARRLRSDLVATLLRRTRDPVLAEDLAQQTFVQLLRGLPRFRGRATLRTWAHRIADNVWHDHLRREAVRASDQRSEETTAASAKPQSAPLEPDPEELQDRRATHACLVAATDDLSPETRRLLVLHDFEDTPLERAADLVGSSYGAAKVRLHRARRHVAERCREECEPDVGPDGSLLCAPKKPTS